MADSNACNVIYSRYINLVSTSRIVLVHIMKAYTGSEFVVELILNISIDRGERSTSCLGHFATRKIAPVPTVLEAGWAPEPV